MSFVSQDRIQLLRNIEIRGKYKKYLTERYLDRIYVPVIPGSKSYIRFTMVDEELQKVDFTSTKFHIVLHLNEKNYNPFEKYPVNATLLKMRIKSLKQNNVLLVLYHPLFYDGGYILRTRLSRDLCQSQTWFVYKNSNSGCHVTYVYFNSDWWVKNSDSQSELSNGHHKATTDFTWVIVSLDSGVSTSESLYSIQYCLPLSDFDIWRWWHSLHRFIWYQTRPDSVHK